MRDELAAYTGQRDLRDEFLVRLDAGAVRREHQPSHLTASAVVLDPARTGVLLVLHKKVGLWLQPGGHLEDGDVTLSAAALREAVEETGVADLRLTAAVPFRLDRHPAPCGAEHHLDVQFVVEAPAGAVPAVSEESLDVRWFGVDALPQQRIDLGPMVAAAVRA